MDQAIHGLAYVEHLSYIGIFFAVGFSGYAIPVPEELILVLAGYLAAQGISSLPVVIVVGVIGAICGDSLIYYLSGHGSRFTKKYHNIVEKKTKLGWYIRHLKRNPWYTIFLSRFIVGMRFFNPLMSGLFHVPAKIFVSATSSSAVIYIPIVVLVGYYLHDQITTVVRVAESVRHAAVLGLIAATGLVVVFFFRNLLKKAS